MIPNSDEAHSISNVHLASACDVLTTFWIRNPWSKFLALSVIDMICPDCSHALFVVNVADTIGFAYALSSALARSLTSWNVLSDVSVINGPSTMPSPHHSRACIAAMLSLSDSLTLIGWNGK